MTNKKTKREYFAILKDVVEDNQPENMDELLEFIDHEVELLNRKSAKSGQTKTQKENVEIKEQILSALMGLDKPIRVSELMAIVPYSSQKLSSLLSQLVDDKKVTRTEEKGKPYFSIATEE